MYSHPPCEFQMLCVLLLSNTDQFLGPVRQGYVQPLQKVWSPYASFDYLVRLYCTLPYSKLVLVNDWTLGLDT